MHEYGDVGSFFTFSWRFHMIRTVLSTIVASAVVLAASAAPAATVFDSALAAPGFYNGTGGVNAGFAVTTDNGIEIGLRAALRQNPNDIGNPGSNIYYVPPGFQTNITSGGNGANPARAAWNFDFSVNLQPGNTSGTSSGLTLADVSVVLTRTGGGTGPAVTNPFTLYIDNAGWGTTGEVNPAVGTSWGFQNSRNPLFPDLGIDPFLPATYTFTMDVYRTRDQLLLATNSIVVNVVPLPASAWTGLSLLTGLGVLAYAKRRRQQAAV
jgi:hypothetical protein